MTIVPSARATAAGMRRRSIVVACALVATAGCASTGGTRAAAPGPTPRHPRLDPCPGTGQETQLARLTLRCIGQGGPPKVNLARIGGTPTLINLWASWCVPCQAEMPALQRAYQKSGRVVAFLGVDTKDEPNSAQDFLAAFHVTYPQVEDRDGEMLASLHALGLPVTIVLDSQGRVAWRKSGRLREGDIEAALAAAVPKDSGTP